MNMPNKRGEMGESWGTATETGAKGRGDPWKVSRQVRS